MTEPGSTRRMAGIVALVLAGAGSVGCHLGGPGDPPTDPYVFSDTAQLDAQGPVLTPASEDAASATPRDAADPADPTEPE